MHACVQKQLQEEVNELTSRLTMKEKDVIRLADDNKLLLKKISEYKQIENTDDKVWTYIRTYIHMYVRVQILATFRYVCVYIIYACGIPHTAYYLCHGLSIRLSCICQLYFL